jgi:hypothetical protein
MGAAAAPLGVTVVVGEIGVLVAAAPLVGAPAAAVVEPVAAAVGAWAGVTLV